MGANGKKQRNDKCGICLPAANKLCARQPARPCQKAPQGVFDRLNGRKHSLAAVVYYSGICLFPELTDQLLPGGEKALNSPAGQQDRGNNFHLHVLLGIADSLPLPLGIGSVF